MRKALLLTGCNSTTSDYHTLAYQDALQAGIPADKFIKQIDIESGFNPDATSSVGAIGIAQFMPSTASGLGIDPHDPVASLSAAAQLMARYNAQYRDYRMALAAYNAGTGTLQWAINNCGYYYWCLPGETQNYIHEIMD